MSDNINLFEILGALREELAKIEVQLKNMPTDKEFAEYQMQMANKINKIVSAIRFIRSGQKLTKAQLVALKASLKEDKKEEREIKKQWKKWALDISKDLIKVGLGAAIALWLT